MPRPVRLLPILLLPAVLLLAGTPSRAQASPEKDAALKRALQTRRVRNVRFEDASLDDVVKWVRVASGFNVVVKRVPLARAGIDPDDIRVTLTLDDVTFATLLDLALDAHDLAVLVKDNIVYVTTRADALGPPVTRLYGISHITWTKYDFIAPEINLHPSDYMPAEEYEPERVVEDDPLNTGDAVAELLQELVAPGQWDTEGWSVRATDRYLVVRAPKAVHAQIDRALAAIASLK